MMRNTMTKQKNTELTKDLAKSALTIGNSLKSACDGGKVIVPFCPGFDMSESFDNSCLFDLKEHCRILNYSAEDQVISVECGISLAALDDYLTTSNQWLPLSYGSRPKTLFETIITGNGGALEHAYGGPRRLVLGLTLACVDGGIIHTGGRVVKNVTGYDLTKLIIGSYGYFALPVVAHLRLYGRPASFSTLLISGDDAGALLKWAAAISQLRVPAVSVELLTRHSLKSEIVFGNDALFYLLVRIAGVKNVLDQAEMFIRNICDGAVVKSCNGVEELRLWADLCDSDWLCRACKVEVNASCQTIERWWQRSRCLNGRFTFSPGVGRFKFFADTGTQQNSFIAELTDYAIQARDQLTIIYLDQENVTRIDRLGLDSVIEEKLLADLKRQFDPSHSLKPRVRFGRL